MHMKRGEIRYGWLRWTQGGEKFWVKNEKNDSIFENEENDDESG